MGEAVEIFRANGILGRGKDGLGQCYWYEEEIDNYLKWSFALNSVLHRGTSQYQDIALLDTKYFGKLNSHERTVLEAVVIRTCMLQATCKCVGSKSGLHVHSVLVIDGKMQSAETDDVFIMGGGEGSAAREILKHKNIDKVVMCDIDEAALSVRAGVKTGPMIKTDDDDENGRLPIYVACLLPVGYLPCDHEWVMDLQSQPSLVPLLLLLI
ncbi:hypothetical protein ACLOJK_034879 [Asimina triloba]